jgi:hypothetical protein
VTKTILGRSRFVTETKGKRLEEMEEYFARVVEADQPAACGRRRAGDGQLLL